MNKTLKGKKRINLIPMKRMAKPIEMANYLVFLASEENSFMTNETLSVTSGGINKNFMRNNNTLEWEKTSKLYTYKMVNK